MIWMDGHGFGPSSFYVAQIIIMVLLAAGRSSPIMIFHCEDLTIRVMTVILCENIAIRLLPSLAHTFLDKIYVFSETLTWIVSLSSIQDEQAKLMSVKFTEQL